MVGCKQVHYLIRRKKSSLCLGVAQKDGPDAGVRGTKGHSSNLTATQTLVTLYGKDRSSKYNTSWKNWDVCLASFSSRNQAKKKTKQIRQGPTSHCIPLMLSCKPIPSQNSDWHESCKCIHTQTGTCTHKPNNSAIIHYFRKPQQQMKEAQHWV